MEWNPREWDPRAVATPWTTARPTFVGPPSISAFASPTTILGWSGKESSGQKATPQWIIFFIRWYFLFSHMYKQVFPLWTMRRRSKQMCEEIGRRETECWQVVFYVFFSQMMNSGNLVQSCLQRVLVHFFGWMPCFLLHPLATWCRDKRQDKSGLGEQVHQQGSPWTTKAWPDERRWRVFGHLWNLKIDFGSFNSCIQKSANFFAQEVEVAVDLDLTIVFS